MGQGRQLPREGSDMRLQVALVIGLLLSAMTGCSATRECCRHDDETSSSVSSEPLLASTPSPSRSPELASALLFDPHPAQYDAQMFAQRSDWPSAYGYYSPGQVIYFSDRFVDYQGRNWGNLSGALFGSGSSSYRRAESYKVGVGYR